MSKVSEFYSKAVSEETSAKKLAEILGGKDMSKATDEQLLAVGKLASELGYDITIDEAKAFLSDGELDEDDLDSVAGGKGTVTVYERVIQYEPGKEYDTDYIKTAEVDI